MKFVLSYLLFAFAIITGIFVHIVYVKFDRKEAANRIYVRFAMGSIIWSLCWSFLLIQENETIAYYLRVVGMLGVFYYLGEGLLLYLNWTNIQGRTKKWLRCLAFSGFLLYYFNVQKEGIVFYEEWFGMSYRFVPNFWTNAYAAYSVAIGTTAVVLSIIMRKDAVRKSEIVRAKASMICLSGFIIGMFLDTIFPILGFGAFPGSSIGQAVTAVTFFFVIRFSNNVKLSFANMSEYICYSSKTPIIIVDQYGEISIANDSTYELLRLDKSTVLNSNIAELFEGEQLLEQLARERDFECVCHENQRHYLLGSSMINDDFSELLGYVVVMVDVTEKHIALEQLKEEKDKANQANLAKSIFLAKMSHEIRTPINGILGMNEMILRESTEEEIGRYAQNIKNSANMLLDIINEILDSSKIESGKMEIVPVEYHIDALLHDLYIVMLLKAKEKGLELFFEIDESIPIAYIGDDLRIKQIILNILNNAVKYTQKGKVTLKVTGIKPEVDVEKSGDFNNNEIAMLRVSVEDTGEGIKEEDIDRLFDAYVRINQIQNRYIEGAGLGLNIVMNLLKLMGSELHVESEYGKGSNFWFDLKQPILDHSPIGDFNKRYENSLQQQKKYEAGFTAERARILVVDDSKTNRLVFKNLLKKQKMQIDEAEGGERCIELCLKNHYDIIFLDHMMPDMDGIETFHRLKELEHYNRMTPMIMLTANAVKGAEQLYFDEGMDDFMSKPIIPKELEEMILKYLPTELID